jgi:Ca2+-binding EF-hand superfamily protein
MYENYDSFQLDEFIVKRIFCRFDRDNDQRLNFEELFLWNLFIHQQSDHQKLKFIVKLFDRDRTKYFTRTQILVFLHSLFNLFSILNCRHILWQLIHNILNDHSLDHRNGKVSWTSICTSIHKNSSLFSSLKSHEID